MLCRRGEPTNNGLDQQSNGIKAVYSEQDAPVWRGQNTASTATNKPILQLIQTQIIRHLC